MSLTLPRIPSRAHVVFTHDIFMAAASFVLSLYLRTWDAIFRVPTDLVIQGTVLFTVIAAAVFWYMGLYRGVWRYASMNDLLAITRSVSVAILVFLLVMFLWTRLDQVPRSVVVINWFVLMALLGGPRFLYRLLKDRRFDFHLEKGDDARVPVLLAGAGDGTEMFIRALTRDRQANYRVVGIVAEKPSRVGHHIHGIEVMGTTRELAAVARRLAKDPPQRLILTHEDMEGSRVRALLDEAAALGMTLARLPRLTDFKSGIGEKVEVKPVAIEDLLGRPQTPLDRDAMEALIDGRRVLVTGAGGSIGAELVRQITDLNPAVAALLDNSEHNLYTIEMEATERHPGLDAQAFIADVRDGAVMERILTGFRPDLVFHAAALKRVPLVEANVFEGVMTNVIGTVNVARACISAGVGTMVLISTDKAVNPGSVMGATKRIAESFCQALDLSVDCKTRFVTVRFGNVLGSTGSVVPLFQKQLAAGGPITLTDPDMKRYFMTVREAVELVLQASALGGNGHEGKIFVLDMGEPVLIRDLAEQMIRLSGLRPGDDIKIEVIGVRPGEKMYEDMFHSGEALVPTPCEGILLAAPRPGDSDVLARAVAELAQGCAEADVARVMALIRRLVPEYRGEALEAPRAASG